MVATRGFNVGSGWRATLQDGVVTIAPYWTRGHLLVVIFATRYDGGFSEAQVDPAWAFLGRVRAVGPWFGDEEYWYVICARRYDLTSYAVSDRHTVARGVDALLADDTPLRCAVFYAPANSVSYQAEVLSGYLDRITPPTINPPDGLYGELYSLHVAAPGPHYLMNDWTKTYGVVQYPGEEYDSSWYRKHWTSPYAEDFWVAGKAVIEWPKPGGQKETERRTWFGATTMVQRLSLIFSTAAPTPPKPVITEPVPGRAWVDPSKPWQVKWESAPSLAGTQQRYWMRVQRGASTLYRDVAAQVWTSVLTSNVSQLAQADIPAGALTSGEQVTIQIATQGVTGGMSPWSDPLLVSTGPAPTATVSVQEYVSGEVSVLTPTVLPSGTPGDASRALTGWSYEVLDAAGVVVQRAEVTGMTGRALEPLTNGGAYTVRVRVMQDGGAVSEPAGISFTVAASVPGTPSLTPMMITHETSEIDGVGVLADFPWDSDGFDWAGTPVVLAVERSSDDGVTWTRVGEPEPLRGSAAQMLRDWYIPEGQYVYRVRAQAVPAAGGTLYGEWGYSHPVVYKAGRPQIVPDGRPEMGVRPCWVTDPAETYGTGGKADARIASQYKAVSYTAATAPERTITLRTDTQEDRDRMRALMQAGALLWVLGYPELDRDRNEQPARGFWCRAVEDVTAAPWYDRMPFSVRDVTVRFVEQPAPYEVA